MNKPIIVFSSFWDINKLIQNNYFVCEINDILYKINLYNKEPINYSIFSIALVSPSKKQIPSIYNKFPFLPRLDFFCPSYMLLKKYKNDNNWEEYIKEFNKIIKKHKNEIKLWVKNLKDGHIYFLCCWENTNEKTHCHRELLYNAFLNSKSMKNKAIYIYRNGYNEKSIMEFNDFDLKNKILECNYD